MSLDFGERISYAKGYRERMEEFWQMVGHLCICILQAPNGKSDTLNSLYKTYVNMAYKDNIDEDKSPSQKLKEMLDREGETYNPPII
jgi:hypothetical protein